MLHCRALQLQYSGWGYASPQLATAPPQPMSARSLLHLEVVFLGQLKAWADRPSLNSTRRSDLWPPLAGGVWLPAVAGIFLDGPKMILPPETCILMKFSPSECELDLVTHFNKWNMVKMIGCYCLDYVMKTLLLLIFLWEFIQVIAVSIVPFHCCIIFYGTELPWNIYLPVERYQNYL